MKTVRIKITTTQAVHDHLAALIPLGLHGRTVSEAAERVLCEGLIALLPKPISVPASNGSQWEENRWASIEWIKAVKKRDGFKCRNCGSDKNLQAHHVKPWSKFPKLRHAIQNGITLCRTCHVAAHKPEKAKQ